MFHDDGRFTQKMEKGQEFSLYSKHFQRMVDLPGISLKPFSIQGEVHLCEPGFIRSPDGKRIAVLLRENSRRKNSHIIFSEDEGKTWSSPRELPISLTGDRHIGKYAPDGRLFISFRCRSPKKLAGTRTYEGDWVGWIGTWDDLVQGKVVNIQFGLKIIRSLMTVCILAWNFFQMVHLL